MTNDALRSSYYMQWAKTRPPARFDLATSGVKFFPLREWNFKIEDLEINGESSYGYLPLQQELAKKCKVPENCIVAATGTSMANHLVMAALLNPGDEIMVEQPTYEPLLAVARYLRARVLRFQRTFDNGFQVSLEEIERQASTRTRLIVLSNLHNPSSVQTSSKTLKAIGDIARRVGARVLVDEVYLEAQFDRFEYAFQLGPHFVTTTSLTKAYGLNGLRCGWIIAEPELARDLWRLNDLFGVIPAHPAELMSVYALRNLQVAADRARNILNENRKTLIAFLKSHPTVSCVVPENGTTVFPQLHAPSSDEFCNFLLENFDTAVVPGSYFEMPQHVRIGLGNSPDHFTAGLDRLGQALNQFQ